MWHRNFALRRSARAAARNRPSSASHPPALQEAQRAEYGSAAERDIDRSTLSSLVLVGGWTGQKKGLPCAIVWPRPR